MSSAPLRPDARVSSDVVGSGGIPGEPMPTDAMAADAMPADAMQADLALAEFLRSEGRRVVATLTRQLGDLTLAEDAVQDASLRALQAWTRDGVPENPRAWLFVSAKRRAIDILRREKTRFDKERQATIMTALAAPDDAPHDLEDDQLRLIFTCCHPALSTEAQVALSLRVLCGLTVAEVARSLLVSEQTMAKRLTRARTKIAKARIPYVVPGPDELPDRVNGVTTTVYLLFGEGYASLSDGPALRSALADEAIRLGRLLTVLLPGSPAVEGLLATMLLQHSRLPARFDANGDVVLLADQDRALWNSALINEGVALAAAAITHSPRQPARFAVTAAIAGCHALAADPSETDWLAILSWYDVLATIDPNPVVKLNRAAALAESGFPAEALAEVDALAGLDSYFWFHATRAELLARQGAAAEASVAAQRALQLTDSEPQRRLLRLRYPPVPGATSSGVPL
ncbi:RNA polymerase sigma factor [Subtercola frigoramans]